MDPQSYVRSCLPAHTVFTGAILSAAADKANDGVDRISALPDDILGNIVSRIPIKDAVRTTVLSKRWVRLWTSVPLAFYDEQLSAFPESTRVAAVDCILSRHPGPFRAVHISSIEFCQRHLDEWPPLLVHKSVENLVFVGLKKSFSLTFPPSILSCTNLRSLYLGSLDLPSEPPSCVGTFPHLEELVILYCAINQDILNFMLDSSPMLKVFGLVLIHENSLNVRLRGQNLQCANICCFMGSEISVSDVPCLERILFWMALPPLDSGGILKLTVDAAPKVLGYMDAGAHLLRIGEIFVKDVTDVRPSTKVWSVRILALKINFGVLAHLKIMTCWLRCFPNAEILHIQSATLNLPTDEQHNEFYEELDLIGCVQSQINKVVLHDFRCSQSELSFLKYILKTANRLDSITLVQVENSGGVMDTQLYDLAVLPWGCQACCISLLAPGQGYGWNFRRASDLSVEDPFDVVHCKELFHFSKDLK